MVHRGIQWWGKIYLIYNILDKYGIIIICRAEYLFIYLYYSTFTKLSLTGLTHCSSVVIELNPTADDSLQLGQGVEKTME